VADAAVDVGRRAEEGRRHLEIDFRSALKAMTHDLKDLEAKAAAGQGFSAADAERVLACPDLVQVGVLAESVRRLLHGPRVTFLRVCEMHGLGTPCERGEAGELRLVGTPASADDARRWVQEGARKAAGVPLTGFSAADLLELAGGDHLALADLSRALAHEGLEAVAEVPLDLLGDIDNAVEVVRAIRHGGLAAWRATIQRAEMKDRLALIERASEIHRETSAFKAIAPLPRVDPREQPSTGYDDVRTIAIARLVCREIASVQVDWPLYGPKLAQVAIAFGADDIDGVAAVDTLGLGPRRAPREDIERQIRAAAAEPVERDGRFESRV
jgi:aminodeoxyfutalosine synthase